MMRQHFEYAALTMGARGSMLTAKDVVCHAPPVPVPCVKNTTGAGDVYASGVLYGLLHHMNLETIGTIASSLSSHVIAHEDGRSTVSLKEILESKVGPHVSAK